MLVELEFKILINTINIQLNACILVIHLVNFDNSFQLCKCYPHTHTQKKQTNPTRIIFIILKVFMPLSQSLAYT